MWKEQVKKIFFTITIVLAIILIIVFINERPRQEKPAQMPSVSIGCDRLVWRDTMLELRAITRNIDAPAFQWHVDGMMAGSGEKLRQKFELGEHQVILSVSFGSQTLQANQTITAVDSVEGVSLRDYQAFKNQWGYQTVYRGRDIGVKGVRVYVDSLPPQEVNACGQLSTRGLFAGEHKWMAEYQGKTIALGNFTLKEVSEIKIAKIEVNQSYRAGETVDGKMVLRNTGTTTIKEIEIKTTVINRRYEWMGEIAKKEYTSKHSPETKPGEAYEIPIQVTIPEKVDGIRPTGSYTITINLMLGGKTTDIKTVSTEVK